MAKIDRQYLRNLVNGLQGISAEDRSQLLQLVNEQKRYGLVWEDKPEEAEQIMKEKLPIIEEVEDKRIINDTSEEKYPNHIIIEGDNLHALTTLCYTHEGKIDVIYIDPPYNTGNKDFKYNDNYVDKEDAYRHSKWLSFMYRRLKLAKRLLSDRGVIFISIDDNEQAQLKLLCDNVLGGNFIENYIWESTFRPDNTSPIIRRNAEFILCYAKNKNRIQYFKGISSKTEGMPSLTKAKEKIKVITFPEKTVHTLLANGVYKRGVRNNGRNPKWELLNDVIVENGICLSEVRLKGHSYWATNDKIQYELSEGTEIWIKTDNFVPYYKKNKESINRPTKILDSEITKDYIYANAQISNIFDSKVFNNPKPTHLVSFLCDFTDNKNSIILDFFAGSGTTLHATMQLNNEDGGNRQCILVTNNENNICEEVTYERNKRVIQGYTNQKGESIEGLKKNNLRYYKIKAVGREKTLKNKKTLVALSCGMLNIKENIYKEENTFGSLLLKKNKCRYFSQGQKQMLVIIDEEWIAKIVEQLKNMEVKEPIKIYVFSNSGYAWDDDFYEVRDKVEPCALPEAIYNAYKHILPEAEDKIIDTGEEKTLTAEQEEELLRMYEKAMQEE